jgi:hypothetical protein
LFIIACPITNQQGHPKFVSIRSSAFLPSKIKKLLPTSLPAYGSARGDQGRDSDSLDFLTRAVPLQTRNKQWGEEDLASSVVPHWRLPVLSADKKKQA